MTGSSMTTFRDYETRDYAQYAEPHDIRCRLLIDAWSTDWSRNQACL